MVPYSSGYILFICLLLTSVSSFAQKKVLLDKHESIQMMHRIDEALSNEEKDLALYLLYRKDSVMDKKHFTKSQYHKYGKYVSELAPLKRKIWKPLNEFMNLEKKFHSQDIIGAMGVFELDSNFVEYLTHYSKRYQVLRGQMQVLKPQLISQKRVLKDQYLSLFHGSRIESLGWRGSISLCKAGELGPKTYSLAHQRLSFYRNIVHSSEEIYFEDGFNNYAQNCALILAANDSILDYFEDTIPCYNHDGHTGLKYSVSNKVNNADDIINEMIKGTMDSTVRDRRMLLNPNTNVFGLGAAISSKGSIYEVCYVEGGQKNLSKKDIPPFLAYPPAGLFPNSLLPDYWSFTLFDDKVDFSRAKVFMRTARGKMIPLDIVFRNGQLGGKSVVWKMRDPEIMNYTEKVVDILIKKVFIDSQEREFVYSLMLINTIQEN